MKKLLLSISLLAGLIANAQDNILFEDCSTFTVGNVGTDLTGATAGQGGWYTFVSSTASPAGANSDFQVVDMAGTNGNSIKIYGTTSASTTGQTRYLSKDFTTDWANRTSGNDVVQVEYDFYTGSATTTKNTVRTYVYSADGTQAIAGFYFVPETKIIKGWARYDNAGTVGNYIFGLGASGDITLDADTWYKIAFAFDYGTGDVTWKESTDLFYGGVTGACAGIDISELDFIVATAAANTLRGETVVDNIKVSFNALEELLSTNNSAALNSKFSVYPNPSSGVVNVSNTSASLINAISLTDVNGRVVKSLKPAAVNNVEVNISDLATGVYMMKIVSDKGTVTKKVVKN